jgi:hypothetical protein
MNVGWGRGRGEVCQRERETGGWAQFDWMLDGGSLKAWPIGCWWVYFFFKPIDGSLENIFFSCFFSHKDVAFKLDIR